MPFGIRLFVVVSLLLGATLATFYLSQQRLVTTTPDLPLEKLVLATPQIPFSSLLFLAKHKDLFAKHGLDVQLVVTASGKEALEMTLAGKADVAAVATLPIAYVVSRAAKPRILAVISKSDYEHSVVARRDRGIARVEDLTNKTVGTVAGTSAQFYLEALLTHANIARNSVRMQSLTVHESENAIVSGEVDAVALYSPWDKRAAQALGESAVVFSPSLHTTHWTLSSDKNFVETRPQVAKKLLLALLDAQTFIAEHRETSLNIVAQEMGMPRAVLEESWQLYTFDLQLPQSLIATLERESLWLRSQVTGPNGDQTTPLPDFLDYLSFTALQSVKPSAIRITR